MTTKTAGVLQEQVERLVREHLAEQRRLALSAVERAFAVATLGSRPSTTRARSGGRRSTQEMSEVSERLYEAVCAHPGETIVVIGAQLGLPARALSRPMAHLRSSGRVRTAGQRHLTRYFPMTRPSRGA